MGGLTDGDVIALARQGIRILLTEDSDFGRLVYLTGAGNISVMFLRYQQHEKRDMVEKVVRLVEVQNVKLWGRFVVVQPKEIRIRSLPG